MAKNKKRKPTRSSARERLTALLGYLDARQRVSAFVAASVLFFTQQALVSVPVFPYDSGNYWQLSDPAVLLAGPQTIRGIIFPILLAPTHALFKVFGQFMPQASALPPRLLFAVQFAFLLAILAPEAYVVIFGGRLTFFRRLIAPVLTMIFLSGALLYPLSDLPAALMLLFAVSLAVRAGSEHASSRSRFWSLLGSGALAGAAYNTRTIYLFPVVCLLLAIPIIALRRAQPRTRALMTALFVGGVLLVSIPQAGLNYKLRGVFTPEVITESSYSGGLFAFQLRTGIRIQRYETYVGRNISSPAASYLDPLGVRIYAEEGLADAPVTVGSHALIVARHPLEFAQIYARHFINGLDVRDGEVYITADSTDPTRRTPLAILNFLVLFVAGWVVVVRCTTRKEDREQPVERSAARSVPSPVDFARVPADADWPLWLGILVLPVVATIPGAIETRFFLPVHLLAYFTIALNADPGELKAGLRRAPIAVAACFLLASGVYFYVTLGTMATRLFGLPT